MKRFFTDYNIEWLPSAVTIVLFAIFCVIVFLVFHKSAKQSYENASMLPLNNAQDQGDNNHE